MAPHIKEQSLCMYININIRTTRFHSLFSPQILIILGNFPKISSSNLSQFFADVILKIFYLNKRTYVLSIILSFNGSLDR